MKSSVLTIRLDAELEAQLNDASERSGRSRSDIAREAMRRHLALSAFADLRRRIMPAAQSQGYLTDEEVFRDVS